MGENKKISELIKVTTLTDNDELVFVHYEGGSMGPEPTPSPTPTAFVPPPPEWQESDICSKVEVSGLQYISYLNGTYDYVPNQTLSGRPFWVKNGVYDENGELDIDATILQDLSNSRSSSSGFIYYVKSASGDAWWTIWRNINGSEEVPSNENSHCDVCESYSSNHSTKLPYDDEGWAGSTTLTGDCSVHYSIIGDAYTNGYDATTLFFRIEKSSNVSVGDTVTLNDCVFIYDVCGDGQSTVDFNGKTGQITKVTEVGDNIDIEFLHNEDVASNCAGTYSSGGTISI